jgi:hypothetical protein
MPCTNVSANSKLGGAAKCSLYARLFESSDRLCGLVVGVPSYRMEMYCVSCEERTEFIYVM